MLCERKRAWLVKMGISGSSLYECGLLKQIPPGCFTAECYSVFIKESEDWLKERCKISIVFYWKCLYNTKGRMHRKMVRFVDEVNICNSLRCL